MSKIYIAGPMRGHKHFNFDAFFEAELQLQDYFDEVVNPAKLAVMNGFDARTLPADTDWSKFPEEHMSLRDVVRRDLCELTTCTHIALLPKWGTSSGAYAEGQVANWLGLKRVEWFHGAFNLTGYKRLKKTPLKLEVGQKYVTRSGKVVLIDQRSRVDIGTRNEFRSSCNVPGVSIDQWSEDGAWLSYENVNDLVSEYVETEAGGDVVGLLFHHAAGCCTEIKAEPGHCIRYEACNFPSESILQEAIRITGGDRQNQYGPPDQDFARTAQMWSAMKGVDFAPWEVAAFQVALKLSRQTHQRKRDNWVDIAGYANCGSICDEQQSQNS